MDPKEKQTNKHQKVTTPVLNGDSIPCLIDSGSSLSVISLQLAQKFQLETFNVCKGLSVVQTQGILALMGKCYVRLKIGHVSKNIDFFVINNHLPYALIGLPHCQIFKLNIDCVNIQVFQNNKRMPLMNNFEKVPALNTLHLLEPNQDSPENENTGVFVEVYEQEFIKARVFSLSKINCLLLSKYVCIFTKGSQVQR